MSEPNSEVSVMSVLATSHRGKCPAQYVQPDTHELGECNCSIALVIPQLETIMQQDRERLLERVTEQINEQCPLDGNERLNLKDVMAVLSTLKESKES